MSEPEQAHNGMWITFEDWCVLVKLSGYLAAMSKDFPRAEKLAGYRDFLTELTRREIEKGDSRV